MASATYIKRISNPPVTAHRTTKEELLKTHEFLPASIKEKLKGYSDDLYVVHTAEGIHILEAAVFEAEYIEVED